MGNCTGSHYNPSGRKLQGLTDNLRKKMKAGPLCKRKRPVNGTGSAHQKRADPEGVGYGNAQASFALAMSVRAVKAALSLTASSASILRLISTPDFFRPFIKVE